jgi:hypothetical protein
MTHLAIQFEGYLQQWESYTIPPYAKDGTALQIWIAPSRHQACYFVCYCFSLLRIYQVELKVNRFGMKGNVGLELRISTAKSINLLFVEC